MKKRDLIAALNGRLDIVADVILTVENRCMAADGPVTPTSQEITEADLKAIWRAANPSKRPGNRGADA